MCWSQDPLQDKHQKWKCFCSDKAQKRQTVLADRDLWAKLRKPLTLLHLKCLHCCLWGGMHGRYRNPFRLLIYSVHIFPSGKKMGWKKVFSSFNLSRNIPRDIDASHRPKGRVCSYCEAQLTFTHLQCVTTVLNTSRQPSFVSAATHSSHECNLNSRVFVHQMTVHHLLVDLNNKSCGPTRP